MLSMIHRYFLSLALLICATSAHAGGVLVHSSTSALRTPKSVELTVAIESQVASSTVELEFIVEADGDYKFVFPLPVGTSVVGFETQRDGVWNKASITENPQKDVPTLADAQLTAELKSHAGPNPFVISLPALKTGTVRLRMELIAILPYRFGEVSYVYPLAIPDFIAAPVGDFRASISISTGRKLKSVYAEGLEPLEKTLPDANHAVLRYQTSGNVMPEAFSLKYAVEQQGFYAKLLTHHDRCDSDGYFLLIIEPKEDVEGGEINPKHFTFVVDTSGSMSGEKIIQARETARFCVENLNPEDRFNVVSFNSDVRRFFSDHVLANEENKSAALSKIAGLDALGSTNINDALLTGLSGTIEASMARILIFITDGQPTAGVVTGSEILKNVVAGNRSETRIFTFGIGMDVNAELLASLAAQNFGESKLITSADDIRNVVGDLFLRINRPVLTQIGLSFGALQTSDVLPGELTDIYAGTQLLIVGRYKGAQSGTVTLEGTLRGTKKSYPFPVELDACSQNYPFLPKLWAKAKIDELVRQMQKAGTSNPDTIALITSIGLQYGIQTPYTSYEVDSQVAPPPTTGTTQVDPYANTTYSPSSSYTPSTSYSGWGSSGDVVGCSFTWRDQRPTSLGLALLIFLLVAGIVSARATCSARRSTGV